jgi:hypothetical protein
MRSPSTAAASRSSRRTNYSWQFLRQSVTSAAHRLSIAGALTLQREGRTIIYCAKAGQQPVNRRERPARIAATHAAKRQARSTVTHMRRMHSRAGECADAVALSRDPYRLHAAPDSELVTAAAVLAKGLAVAIDAGGLRARRAAALASAMPV